MVSGGCLHHPVTRSGCPESLHNIFIVFFVLIDFFLLFSFFPSFSSSSLFPSFLCSQFLNKIFKALLSFFLLLTFIPSFLSLSALIPLFLFLSSPSEQLHSQHGNHSGEEYGSLYNLLIFLSIPLYLYICSFTSVDLFNLRKAGR